ncbi:MAG: exodeoxyribonuclease VII large subunit [Deltaproteobacteria bacterium]|nr:exodeoxyribonuclease VII large subunit [Deltaproteobacteria bacterium]
MENDNTTSSRRLYSVSELTSEIKGILEEKFAFIWISGEISNFKIPASGHFYFTLKDSAAQIQSVMFKGQSRKLKFLPEDGMKITGFGRVGVYAPRGSYQIIFEYLEPAGAGALQAAFEQLKKKLAAEGLFSEQRKRPIPFIAANVVIISSPTGAVVHDIIRVMHRRFENISIRILPVKVQGADAVFQITQAFAVLNELTGVDVAILARGGGSLEDLAPFNSEPVARAIVESRVPVVSAVGHETDFTISDFVADLRAPTPSAAAELVTPVKVDLVYTLSSLDGRMYAGISKLLKKQRTALKNLEKRLEHPAKRLCDLRLKTDDFSLRMNAAMLRLVASIRERTEMYANRLYVQSPSKRVLDAHRLLAVTADNLKRSMLTHISLQRQSFMRISEHLGALDPGAILARGYSITRTLPGRSLVIDADTVSVGQRLEIVLARGRINVKADLKPGPADVIRKNNYGQKKF